MNKQLLFLSLILVFLFSGCTELPEKIPLEEIQAILVWCDKKGDQVELTVMSWEQAGTNPRRR